MKTIGTHSIPLLKHEAIVRFRLVDLCEDAAIALPDRLGAARVVPTDMRIVGPADRLRLARFVRERVPPIGSGWITMPGRQTPASGAYAAKRFASASVPLKNAEIDR